MSRRLTKSEIQAYAELARAAAKLRRAQRRAERRKAEAELNKARNTKKDNSEQKAKAKKDGAQ